MARPAIMASRSSAGGPPRYITTGFRRRASASKLPGAISRVFEWRDRVRGRMYVGDAWRGLVSAEQYVIGIGFPITGARHGIIWDFAQIAGGDQIIQRLRSGGLVECVLLDCVAHRLEVLF